MYSLTLTVSYSQYYNFFTKRLTNTCLNERLGERELRSPALYLLRYRTVQKMRDRSIGRLVAFTILSDISELPRSGFISWLLAF